MWSTIEYGVILLSARKRIAQRKKAETTQRKIITYVVKPKDSINLIAMKFGVSAQSIISLNGPKVYPGQKIVLS